MRNKVLAGLGIAMVVITPLAFTLAHAQMTTSTLGTNIDSVSGTTTDYFTVLLAKYWPFVVGFLILLGVWHYGKRVIQGFN